MKSQLQRTAELTLDWAHNPRWAGIERPYSPEDVLRLQGSVRIEYSLARQGAERLWELLHSQEYVAGWGPSPATRPCRKSRPVCRPSI